MDDFKLRLLNETKELVEKFKKLKAFFDTETFTKLPRPKKRLLYRQLRVMSEYIEILGERLELEEIEYS